MGIAGLTVGNRGTHPVGCGCAGCAAGRRHDVRRGQERARRRDLPLAGAGRASRSRRSRRRTCRNNSVVTADGGEIGRAQAMQAQACGLAPSVAFNPVLLKPGSDRSARSSCSGGSTARSARASYQRAQGRRCWTSSRRASPTCGRAYDVVVCEGAGSPAEINLRGHRHRQHGAGAGRRPAGRRGRRHRPRRGARAPVRHGRRARPGRPGAASPGFVDQQVPRRPGAARARASTSCARSPAARRSGCVPWAGRPVARRGGLARPRSPTGCSAARRRRTGASGCGWPSSGCRGSPTPPTPRRWPCEPGVAVRYVTEPSRLADADLVVLPGTQRDRRRPRLAARAPASPTRCVAHAAAGRPVLGICGGYQMLGRRIADPDGVEGGDGRRASACSTWRSCSTPEKHLANPVGTALGRAGARLRDPPRARGRAPATAPLVDGRGLRRRAPCSARTGTACWRTTGSAGALLGRVAEQAGRAGFAVAPDTVVRRGARGAARPARRPRRSSTSTPPRWSMSSITVRAAGPPGRCTVRSGRSRSAPQCRASHDGDRRSRSPPSSATTTCGSPCCSTPCTPGVGGVLVRGEKGTAKSTAVRALAALLPAAATSSRAAGSAATRHAPDPRLPGRAARRPDAAARADAPGAGWSSCRSAPPRTGSSARSTWSARWPRACAPTSRGCSPTRTAACSTSTRSTCCTTTSSTLLLDAAAMGRAHVERDGVSVSHAARFLLVGTMNPEEGELRPQLLDRFGLTVEVRASRDVDDAGRGRAPAARVRGRPGRRSPPRWAAAERETAARIADAQARLGVGGAARRRAAPDRRGVRGVRRRRHARGPRHRPRRDRARGLAGRRRGRGGGRAGRRPGWRCRTGAGATRSTSRASTSRRSTTPWSAPARSRDRPGPTRRRPGAARRDGERRRRPRRRPGRPTRRRRTAGQRRRRREPDGRRRTAPAAAGPDGRAARPRPGGRRPPTAAADAARRAGRRGRRPRRAAARPGLPRPAASSSPASARARRGGGRGPAPSSAGSCAPRRTPARRAADAAPARRPSPPPRRTSTPAAASAPGCCCAPTTCATPCARAGRATSCCSPSTPPARWPRRPRMAAVTGAVLSLLRDAYQRRDKVGLITFRGTGAELVLPPTSSVPAAPRPAGPRCAPAAAPRWPPACCAPARCWPSSGCATPAAAPLLVVLTDGRATVGARPGGEPVRDACRAAALLAADGVATVVVDCESGPGAPRPRGAARRAPRRARWCGIGELSADRRRPTSSAPHGARQTIDGEESPCRRDRSRRARRRAHHPPAPQPPAAGRAHRGDEGQVDGRVRAGAARLEPGLVDRGVPVREVGEVEGRRGGGVPGARPRARRDRRGRARRVAQDGRGLVVGAQARAPTTTTPRRPPRAGRRSAAGSRRRPTRCTCSTSSPTR